MFQVLTAIWAVLTAAVLILAIYRRTIANQEDDRVHVLEGEAHLIHQQEVVAHKLDVIDRWGKSITVFVLVYGLGLASYYLYQVWKQTPGVGL